MILHPGVLALLVGSLLVSLLLLGSVPHAIEVLRRWDLASGSALQLALERRTYLVSTLVGWVLAFELASLFLLVFTADAVAPMFTGAMCAAGTLAANVYGYPALLLRLAGFVGAALWLAVNHADNLAPDYPLVRTKHALLLGLAALVPVEGWLQARFFLGLHPEVITSCCGSLFSRTGTGAGARIAAVSPGVAATALYTTALLAAGAGLAFRRSGGATAAGVHAVAGALALPAGLVAVIAFVSPYVYELPTHLCPFCLLQREYGLVGYPLYGALLGGSVCAMAVGVLAPFRRIASLATVLPAFQRRLAAAAALLLAAFAVMAAGLVLGSSLAA